MDEQEVSQWLEFCAGKGDLTPEDFSSIFMELYLEPLTENDKDNLRLVLGMVPNSSKVLDKMFQLDEPIPAESDIEIMKFVKRDLVQMSQLINSRIVLNAMNSPVEVTIDENSFDRTCNSNVNRQFFHEITNYFVKKMSQCDVRIRALSNAFYGIASSTHLQWALTADLLDIDADFSNYFHLHLLGVDYAIGINEIVAINYRGKIEGSS